MSDRFMFRAWQIKKEQMSYEVVPAPCVLTVAGSDYDEAWEYCAMSGEHAELEDCMIMQCTGIEDQNGNLIYEGDIVRVSKPNCYLNGVYEVRWHPMGMWAYYNHGDWALKGNEQPYLIKQKNCEVIGNVCEDQKLLRGE